MKQEHMHLINKIFNNKTIRTVWDKDSEKYYISVIDIVSIVSESNDRRKYWNKLKQRLKKEKNQSVTNCSQLKLKASDGKYYNTAVAEPIKRWLARFQETVITKDNVLSYEYVNETKSLEEKR